MAASLCLVLGGVRSGKSAFAEEQVRRWERPTLYLATGQATDPEMSERIRRHQQRRPDHWRTLEEPLDLAGALAGALTSPEPPEAVLLDSLDGWVGNLLLKHEDDLPAEVETRGLSELERLLDTCQGVNGLVCLVSSEVGLSLVPPYPLGRRFQDLLGLVNQRVAAAADRVYLVVAGVPLAVKG